MKLLLALGWGWCCPASSRCCFWSSNARFLIGVIYFWCRYGLSNWIFYTVSGISCIAFFVYWETFFTENPVYEYSSHVSVLFASTFRFIFSHPLNVFYKYIGFVSMALTVVSMKANFTSPYLHICVFLPDALVGHICPIWIDMTGINMTPIIMPMKMWAVALRPLAPLWLLCCICLSQPNLRRDRAKQAELRTFREMALILEKNPFPLLPESGWVRVPDFPLYFSLSRLQTRLLSECLCRYGGTSGTAWRGGKDHLGPCGFEPAVISCQLIVWGHSSYVVTCVEWLWDLLFPQIFIQHLLLPHCVCFRDFLESPVLLRML